MLSVVPGVAVPPWATETVLSPCLVADEDRVLHVLSHIVWWKKKCIYIYIYIDIDIMINEIVLTS